MEADVHSSPKISSGGSDLVPLDTQEIKQLGESAQVDEAETAEVDGAETDEFGDFQETDGYGYFQKTDDVDVSLEGAVTETDREAAPASDLDIYDSHVAFMKVGQMVHLVFTLYCVLFNLDPSVSYGQES